MISCYICLYLLGLGISFNMFLGLVCTSGLWARPTKMRCLITKRKSSCRPKKLHNRTISSLIIKEHLTSDTILRIASQQYPLRQTDNLIIGKLINFPCKPIYTPYCFFQNFITEGIYSRAEREPLGRPEEVAQRPLQGRLGVAGVPPLAHRSPAHRRLA